MGWVSLAVLAIGAGAALWRLGVARPLASFAAAALTLGAAGYAWQGRAALPAHPVTSAVEAIDVDPGLVAFRELIMPGEARVLAAADDRLRAGDTRGAATTVFAALDRSPRDPALWTGLGNVIAAHDDGQMSPAALFAFRRAWRLAPDRPGPPFFLGMAYVQADDLASARIAWLRALALTPRDAPYRLDIAERLMMLDQFQAMNPAP